MRSKSRFIFWPKFIAIGAALVLMVILPSCQFFRSNELNANLEKNGFRLGKEWGEFKPFQGLEADNAQIKTYKNANDELLRIVFFQDMAPEDAFQLAKNRSLAVSSLFSAKDAPYLGQISVTESCLSKNKVSSSIENKEDGFSLLYSLMATSNFVYGSCSEKEDIFQSYYLIRYCQKSRTLVEAKIFVGRNKNFSSSNFSLECVI